MEENKANEELNELKDNVSTREDKNEDEEGCFIVNVHILDRVMPICVGKGTQSFKWLALNATERCRQQQGMNGRMRHREPYYTKPGKYLPEMVDTSETPDELTEPISPRTIIKDVLKPDDHIWITPGMDVKLNKIGYVVESRWKDHAFRQSEFSVEERKEADEKFKAELEAKRKSKEEEENLKLEKIKKEAEKVRTLLYPDMLKTRMPFFSYDWSNVRTSIRMDEQQDTRAYLERSYPRITALFYMYSKESYDGQTGRKHTVMTYDQFCKFVGDCNICEVEKEKVILNTSFYGQLVNNPSTTTVLERGDFIQALLRLSTFKGKAPGQPKGPLCEMLIYMMNTFIDPYLNNCEKTKLCVAFFTNELFNVFSKYITELRTIFNTNSPTGRMEFTNFLDLIKNSNIVPSSFDLKNILDWENFRNDMRDIFSSTFEHDDPHLNNGDPIEKTMSLPEFLEGLLKAGVKKHGQKMKNLCDICEKTCTELIDAAY